VKGSWAEETGGGGYYCQEGTVHRGGGWTRAAAASLPGPAQRAFAASIEAGLNWIVPMNKKIKSKGTHVGVRSSSVLKDVFTSQRRTGQQAP